jgi:D-glycero-alpha-D-manno-heptose-7-phosphate kinase
LGLLHPGASTVNLAIDVAVTVTISASPDGRYRVGQDGAVREAATAAELAVTKGGELLGLVASELDLPPVEFVVESGSPRGAGLGASSALTVAAIAAGEAWTAGEPTTVEWRATLARDLEARLMGLPTGCQDHYPASLGGVLEILHRPGDQEVRRLAVDLEALGEALLVAHSGQSHFSAGTNWQIIRRRLEGDEETVERFHRISEITGRLPAALEAGDLETVGALMTREWEQRRGLAEGVSTSRLEEMLGSAVAAGAWGGKACGAGGGGCVAILAPAARRQAVATALAAEGGRLLPARPVGDPLSVDHRE